MVMVARRRTPPHALAVIVFCTLCTVGCAASHEVDSHGAQAELVDSSALQTDAASNVLCTRLATLQCTAEQRCCMQPTRSEQTCRVELERDCEQTYQLDRVAADPVAGFDSDQAEQVFRELESKLQACDPEVVAWSVGPDGLRSLFTGTVGRGDSCKPADVLTADEASQAAALLSCEDAEQVACLPNSLLGSWTCSSKSDAGGSCVSDDNCHPDAYCDVGQQAWLGQCQARLADDAACNADTQCGSIHCSDGVCKRPDEQAVFCPQAG